MSIVTMRYLVIIIYVTVYAGFNSAPDYDGDRTVGDNDAR